MYTYVSLLRGINVGGRVVKMADLKDCYKNAGFSDVTTVLQSGNVIFQSDVKAAEQVRSWLEAVISKRFNYSAKVMVYEQHELTRLADQYPFDTTSEQYQHYIIFLRPGLSSKLVSTIYLLFCLPRSRIGSCGWRSIILSQRGGG